MQLALQRCQPPRIVFWLGRIAGSRAVALSVSLLLAIIVAALDYATGYELRMAILYLVPIALATWVGGCASGMAIVGLSSLFWLSSFRSTHPYSGEIFFYWEGVVMIAVYTTFVLLLARLRVTLSRSEQRFFRVLDGLHAAVYVADQGAGLSETAGEQIYTPFFTTRTLGLGLGLPICRSVIEAHGGRIWHEANASRGCIFHFTLPQETSQ